MSTQPTLYAPSASTTNFTGKLHLSNGTINDRVVKPNAVVPVMTSVATNTKNNGSRVNNATAKNNASLTKKKEKDVLNAMSNEFEKYQAARFKKGLLGISDRIVPVNPRRKWRGSKGGRKSTRRSKTRRSK